MRAVTFLVALGLPAFGLPTIGHADVWQDRVIPCEPGDELAITSSSRVLYVNDCLPNGCAVTRGNNDSSLTDTSSIASANTRMSGYMHGQAHWDGVIECVKKGFSSFDITVVTEPPTGNHYEVMAGGTSLELNPSIEGAGGIAPFISCGAQRDNALAFVFANQTSDPIYLCTAIVHEAGHVYGLSHSLDGRDPMTYMDLGSPKTWQNSEAKCGTETPQACRCQPTTSQNSFRVLQTTFGLAPGLAEMSLALTTPKEGQWVKPGFPIGAVMTSPLDRLEASLIIDGAAMTLETGPLAWNAPATITAGPHTVGVSATDYADRTATAMATVNVMASCNASTACEKGFHCLGGFCLPSSDVDGGLGASCTGNDDCVTGSCGASGDDSRCTSTCDAGNVCPSGFDCLGGDGSTGGVCWPSEGGGCTTSGGGSPGLLLAGLGAMVLALRRRR